MNKIHLSFCPRIRACVSCFKRVFRILNSVLAANMRSAMAYRDVALRRIGSHSMCVFTKHSWSSVSLGLMM